MAVPAIQVGFCDAAGQTAPRLFARIRPSRLHRGVLLLGSIKGVVFPAEAGKHRLQASAGPARAAGRVGRTRLGSLRLGALHRSGSLPRPRPLVTPRLINWLVAE